MTEKRESIAADGEVSSDRGGLDKEGSVGPCFGNELPSSGVPELV